MRLWPDTHEILVDGEFARGGVLMSVEILVGLVSFASLIIAWAIRPAHPEPHGESVRPISATG